MQYRLKVALVSDFCYPFTKGGVESRYYTLAKYLVSKGHCVTWFTSRQWDGAPQQLVEGIRIRCIIDRIDAFNGSRRSIKEALQFGVPALGLVLMREQFDVVDMSQYPFFHLFAGKLYTVLRHTPVVVSWYEFWGDHWLEYLGQSKGKVGRLVERWTARFAGNIIAVSDHSHRQLLAIGCDPGSTYYVPNWIDYEHIVELVPIGSPYEVCYFGRLKDHKNVGVLLKALALCRNEGLVLGTKILGDGPERQNLEKLAQELQIGSQVDFLGRIEHYDDLLGYVKSAQLFVNPSTKEGGGSITCLEANACGVPTIAVRHPLGLDENLIVEGQNGQWVTEETPRAIADKLHEYFKSDVKHRQEMSRRAIEWARQYSVENLCRQIEKIYLNLANQKTRSK